MSNLKSTVRNLGISEIPDDLKNFDFLPDAAHVRQPVVEALFGFSASTVWRRVKPGDLPQPVRLGPRVTAWRVGDLRAALDRLGAHSVRRR